MTVVGVVRGDAGSVFSALADPTRRQIVEWLSAEGTGTATELASRLPISRQAVTRHLSELERAGVVVSVKSGRERLYRFEAAPLADAQRWLSDRTSRWDRTLERLRVVLDGDGE